MSTDRNINPAVRRRAFLYTGMGVALAGLVLGVFLIFPRMMHRNVLSGIAYAEIGGEPLIVAAYQEIANNDDDGDHLAGYEVRTYRPGEQKPIAKHYIEHYTSGLPTPPSTALSASGTFWILQEKAFIQGDTGFAACLRIKSDGSIEEQVGHALQGYAVGGMANPGHLSITNRYNEPYCFDIKRERVSTGTCPWEDPTTGKSAAFFEVRKAATSTRSQIWHVRTSQPAPPAEGFAGFVSGDRPLPGMGILQDLQMSRGHITEERFAWYQSHADSAGLSFTPILTQGYLEQPWQVDVDEESAIWLYTGEGGIRLVCFSASGGRRWDVPCPDPVQYGHPLDLQCQRSTAQTIVTAPQHWAIAIDNRSGEVRWTFLPD